MARFLDSDLLRRVRTELGLTQDEAARRLGIDARSYRRYESGAVNHPRDGFEIRHASRRRAIDRICVEFGIEEAQLLTGRARARHFVGRDALLRDLGAWLDEPAPVRVVSLVALGGAGKTALLERLVADRPAFTWSFYEDARAETFLRELAAHLGSEPDLERLAGALGEDEPRLLALDGLEVLQADGRGARARGELEDPALRRLLRTLATGRGRARALVTSRFELADLAPWEGTTARTIRLEALSREEALDLLRRWGMRGAAGDLARVATSLDGHALSLAVAGSYSATFLDGAPEVVPLDEAAADEPLARRLARVVDGYARALSPLERDLLARLAAFASGASLESLVALARAGGPVAGALAGATEGQLRRALRRLARLGLASAAGAVHPFLRERFLPWLGVPEESLHAVERARLEESLRDRPDGSGADRDRVEAVLHATVRAGFPESAYALYARTLGGFAQLGLRAGEMLRGLRVLAALAPDEVPDARLPGAARLQVAYDLGLYAGALGDLARADRAYRVYEHLSGDHVTACRTRAYVARLRGDLARALALAETAVALSSRREDHVVRALALEASIRHDLGQVRPARELFVRVRALEGEPEARRALWEAEHLAALGETDRARKIAERVVAGCAALGWTGHVAHARTLLGLLDPSSAHEHLEFARAWCDASGEVEMRLRTYALEARLALVGGEASRAADVARRGWQLADTCGFRLMAVRLRLLAAEAGVRAPAHEALEIATGCGDAWGERAASRLLG